METEITDINSVYKHQVCTDMQRLLGLLYNTKKREPSISDFIAVKNNFDYQS